MATLSAAIMAHPSRMGYIRELYKKLDRPVQVTWDRCQDRIETGTRALLAYDPEATHHCVIQDDAVVPRDFLAGVEQILSKSWFRKDVPLCLYAGNVGRFSKHFKRERQKRQFNWMTMPGMNWGVAVVIPTLEIEPLVSFMKNPLRREPQYDLRMSRYFELKNIKVWYPVPSLVDHRMGPSLLAGHGDGRHAWSFIGEDASALDFGDGRGYAHFELTRKFIG